MTTVNIILPNIIIIYYSFNRLRVVKWKYDISSVG